MHKATSIISQQIRRSSTSTSAVLSQWIKSAPQAPSVREEDHISLTHVKGLVSTLETDGVASSWKKGDVLPPGWSLVLFPPVSVPTSTLGFDGTEKAAHHPPDASLERMWVSGTWSFDHSPEVEQLRVGDEVVCESKVESVVEKTGKDGRKGWYVGQVRKMMRLGSEGGKAPVTERRTHLYRYPVVAESEAHTVPPKSNPTSSIPPPSPSPSPKPDFITTFHPTPEILFRFSALTFNTHKIHWDESYAFGVEKREGLIVHGPLTCLLLLNTLRHALSSDTSGKARILEFGYRATAPLAVGKKIELCGEWVGEGSRECELWVRDEGGKGKMYMKGKAKVSRE